MYTFDEKITSSSGNRKNDASHHEVGAEVGLIVVGVAVIGAEVVGPSLGSGVGDDNCLVGSKDGVNVGERGLYVVLIARIPRPITSVNLLA